MKKLLIILLVAFLSIPVFSQLSNYEKYRIEQEKTEQLNFEDEEWNADEINSITIIYGNQSVLIENDKIDRLIGVLNSMEFSRIKAVVMDNLKFNYQISIDIYEDLYIYDEYVKIGEWVFSVDKDINKILKNLLRELRPVPEQSIFVYYDNYSRFYSPYWTHCWRYPRYYNYYDYYGWNYPYYYPYYNIYPIYVYNSIFYRGRTGNRRYTTYNSMYRTYKNDFIPRTRPFRESYIRNPRSTVASSKIINKSPVQRPQNRIQTRNNIQADQRTPYKRALETGERKAYTPKYQAPRMKIRADYNTGKRVNGVQQRNRVVIPQKNIIQSRTRNSQSYKAPVRSQNNYKSTSSTRSTISRSSGTTRSTMSRSSNSSVSRSSGTRNTSSRGKGKK